MGEAEPPELLHPPPPLVPALERPVVDPDELPDEDAPELLPPVPVFVPVVPTPPVPEEEPPELVVAFVWLSTLTLTST